MTGPPFDQFTDKNQFRLLCKWYPSPITWLSWTVKPVNVMVAFCEVKARDVGAIKTAHCGLLRWSLPTTLSETLW